MTFGNIADIEKRKQTVLEWNQTHFSKDTLILNVIFGGIM